MIVQEYQVEGMTCGHCAAAVTAEVEHLDGVVSAVVDVATGGVRLTSESELDRAQVAAAVDEAGYALVAA